MESTIYLIGYVLASLLGIWFVLKLIGLFVSNYIFNKHRKELEDKFNQKKIDRFW